MSYVCVKRVKLGDRAFAPGEAIPDELFAKGRASKLVSYGYIAEVAPEGVMELSGVDAEAVNYMTVVLEEGGEPLPISNESLQTVVNTMKQNADNAVAAIEEEVDESVLSFIVAVDSRKSVKQAAQKQLAVLSSLRGDSNAPEGDSGATDGE